MLRKLVLAAARSVLVLSLGGALIGHFGTANAAEPTKSAATGRISGRVLDPDGKPVANASIRLYEYDADARRWKPRGESIRSAADGSYEFASLPEGWQYALAVESPRFAKALRTSPVEEGQQLTIDMALRKPVTIVVRLRDEKGAPVAGAQLQALSQSSVNGRFAVRANFQDVFGVRFAPSDAEGRLVLPPLPEGAMFTADITHPTFAPIGIKDSPVKAGAEVAAVMHPGVTLTFQLSPAAMQEKFSEVEIDLRHEPFESPSTRFDVIPFDNLGRARITVEPGKYRLLWLRHNPDFLISPRYSSFRKTELALAPGVNDHYVFDLHRKVVARGRVINEATGKPVMGASIQAEIPNTVPAGGKPELVDPWMHADWAETDAKGEFKVTVAAGPCRVSFQERGYQTKQDHLQFAAAPDGSTVIPEIRVSPMPKVIGTVVGADGKPVANTIVRFRGKSLHWVSPALTDAKGHFEIQIPFIPLDEKEKRIWRHPLVAFHAYEPLGARADVYLNRPATLSNVTIHLEHQPYERALDDVDGDLGAWEKADFSVPYVREGARPEVRGQAAPKLECQKWLNAPSDHASLADFRGRYVFLDFWTTWCGPCRGDYPTVKMAYDLYKDHGLAVIGVHDNSVAPDSIRKHVEKEKMPFPIAIDRANGTTLAAYQKIGLNGYPTYVLLGPDGTILNFDPVLPGRLLRGFKLEIIRARLMGAQAVVH
jgi:thiol-disulfide isomerase/thioredoxin/protocatechuate 3,4-dioxygenase beta subunit